jgi:predicted HicB family RNase H-like nuclease
MLAIAWIVTGGVASAVEIKDDSMAVSVIGKQRMYSMRMLKDYIMIGLKLHYGNPEEDLKKTMQAFEEAHKALMGYVKDPELRKKLEELDRTWRETKKTLQQPPEKAKAPSYKKMMVRLREVANDATNMMAKKAGGVSNQTINLAGRLRAVSQALAAVYMLKTWEMAGADEALKIPMKRFRDSMDFLYKSPDTGPEMLKILKKLEKTYLFFQVMNQSGTFTPTLVAKKTDRMLKEAIKLTRLYVEKKQKK